MQLLDIADGRAFESLSAYYMLRCTVRPKYE